MVQKPLDIFENCFLDFNDHIVTFILISEKGHVTTEKFSLFKFEILILSMFQTNYHSAFLVYPISIRFCRM